MAESKQSYWEDNLDPSNLKRPDGQQKFPGKYLSLIPHENEIQPILHNWEKGKIIVDLGTGLGQYSIFFARNGWKVIGVDITLARLKTLKETLEEQFPGIRVFLIQARAEALPFKNRSVDYVFSHSVLIHTNLPKALAEAARVMQQGGSFIEPSPYNPFARLYRRFLAPPEWKDITTYFSKSSIQNVRGAFPAENFSLNIRQHHFLNFLSYFWYYGCCLPGIFRVFNRIFNIIDRFIFKIFSLQWFWMYEIQIRRKK